MAEGLPIRWRIGKFGHKRAHYARTRRRSRAPKLLRYWMHTLCTGRRCRLSEDDLFNMLREFYVVPNKEVDYPFHIWNRPYKITFDEVKECCYTTICIRSWADVAAHTMPTREAIDLMVSHIQITRSHLLLSVGCGHGLWEYLLKLRGVQVRCIDNNDDSISYLPIQTVSVYDLPQKQWDATTSLLLGWPDARNNLKYDSYAVSRFQGNTVFLTSQSKAAPYDDVASEDCFKQLELNGFKCTSEYALPRGYMTDYSPILSVFTRVT
jgi:hypothetical protein